MPKPEYVKFGVDLEGTLSEGYSQYSEKQLLEGLRSIDQNLKDITAEKLQRYFLDKKIEEGLPLSDDEVKLHENNKEEFVDCGFALAKFSLKEKGFLTQEDKAEEVKEGVKEKKVERPGVEDGKTPKLYGIDLKGTPYESFTKESLAYLDGRFKSLKVKEPAVKMYLISLKKAEDRTDIEKDVFQKFEQSNNQKLKDNCNKIIFPNIKKLFRYAETKNNRQKSDDDIKSLFENHQDDAVDDFDVEKFIEENDPNADPVVKEENIKLDKKAIQEAVKNYEEKLNNNTELNSVIAESKVLKGKSEIDRSESLALTENFDDLQEEETAMRKAMPMKQEGPSISVPDLIKDQMLLNDGYMSPLQKWNHYNNIIQMKDMDGDKYSKQLMDYRLKVAEEAGKEFDKKHQDPTKLSFLNKSANAIETVMCAMSRNPLGIGILLVAALNAPLLIVGLLAFTAWKRKRPNPAYQQAWKEQTQRELAAKRQQLATLYGRDPSELSEREVTKALRSDYVNQKLYDALDAKLERDAQKTVDSATKKYAKAISKETGEKFRSKDLRDHAEKELMRKKLGGNESYLTMKTARENRLKEAINQHESKKGMGGRSI